MKLTAEERSTALSLASRADRGGAVCALRSGGQAITADKRDELLARAVAGQYVELEAEVLAYEQKPGEQNRNFVRFRDGAMMGLGRSGKGNPFLRDHEQTDVTARAGTVLDSSTEKRGDGDYVIRQTVKLTAPWAVDLALRGLLDSVSIGWNPTGPVLCSECGTEALAACWHFPGDRLSRRERDDGTTKLVSDPAGDIVIEFVFTAAELIETSNVSVPGVRTASMENVRAALSAAHHPGPRGIPPHSLSPQEDMTNPRLLAILSLAATAGETEVLSAVESIHQRAAVAESELAIVRAELGVARTDLNRIAGEQRKTAQDAFIAGALASGRITTADESQWREFHGLAADRAVELMAARPAHSATPVGAPRQSASTVKETPATEGDEKTRAALSSNHINPEAALHFAKQFGAKKPADALRLAVVGKDA